MARPPDLRGGDPPYKQSTSLSIGPKFLVMSRVNLIPSDDNLSNVSPFLIKKVIDNTCDGEVELCKKLRNGTVLIKTKNLPQALKLSKLRALSESIKVSVTEHNSLNFVRGVIYSNDLRGITEEDILGELKSQQVAKVHKILKRENENLKETGLIVLTFEALNLPAHIFVGYEKLNVRPYIPLPMRCNNCLTFGHVAKFCKKEKVCRNCGDQFHITEEMGEICGKPKNCINCKSINSLDCRHSTTDRSCPIFLKEKEIQAIITLEKVNRYTAVSKYNDRHPQLSTSFATITRTNINQSSSIKPAPAPSSRKVVDYSEVTLPRPQTLNTVNRVTKNKTIVLPVKTSARLKNKLKKMNTNVQKDIDIFSSEASDEVMETSLA